MSTNRIGKDAGFKTVKPNPDGVKTCRGQGCDNPVAKGRRNWCGEECIHKHKMRTNPSYVRGQVWDRDSGVCAACGLDTREIAMSLARLKRHRRYDFHLTFARTSGEHAVWRWCWDHLSSLRFNRGQSLWQADHIREVRDGGGECDLDNYQTLCVPCHKAKTKARSGERAKKKKRPPSS